MSDVGGAQQQAVMLCVCGLFIYVYGILSLNFSAMLFLDARKSRASHARMPWEHKTKHTRVRVHTSHNYSEDVKMNKTQHIFYNRLNNNSASIFIMLYFIV